VNQQKADGWLLGVAHVTADQATCARRRVGCVLADLRNRILSTGFNGPPRGFPQCTALSPCDKDAVKAPTGLSLDLCLAVHAEQNALLQCSNVDAIHTCCCTVLPCITCVKLLLNTTCQRIVYTVDYPAHHEAVERMWLASGRWLVRKPRDS
jgi:dCMP deaminase